MELFGILNIKLFMAFVQKLISEDIQSMLDYTYICNNYKYNLIFYLTNAKQD